MKILTLGTNRTFKWTSHRWRDDTMKIGGIDNQVIKT